MIVEKTSAIKVWFPHRFCVNLDRRPDRWAAVGTQFRRHGLDPVTRFPAYDGLEMEIPEDWKGPPGGYGCLRSHLEIVCHARAQGYPNVLILEDDVVFHPDLETKLPSVLAQLPKDWDMLSFGGIHNQAPLKISENIYRMRFTQSTHAYALKHTIYDAFIELNSSGMDAVDEHNTILQKSFNAYCCMPHLAWQQEGWSDIQQEQEIHWDIRESLVLTGEEMERAIENTVIVIAYRERGDPALSRRNLEHLVWFYRQRLPEVEVLVAASKAELGSERVPRGCRFVPVEGDRPSRDQLFRRGFERASPLGIFLFTDSWIRPSKDRHIQPNLLMCARRGGTTLFDSLIRLDAVDSERLRDGRHKEVRMAIYEPEPAIPAATGAFLLTREVIEGMENRPITELGDIPLFRSPNRGLILHG